MLDDISRRLQENPFHPFTVVTSGGMKYRVASRDHAGSDPDGKRMVIWFDDSSVVLATLHIMAIEEEVSASQIG